MTVVRPGVGVGHGEPAVRAVPSTPRPSLRAAAPARAGGFAPGHRRHAGALLAPNAGRGDVGRRRPAAVPAAGLGHSTPAGRRGLGTSRRAPARGGLVAAQATSGRKPLAVSGWRLGTRRAAPWSSRRCVPTRLWPTTRASPTPRLTGWWRGRWLTPIDACGGTRRRRMWIALPRCSERPRTSFNGSRGSISREPCGGCNSGSGCRWLDRGDPPSPMTACCTGRA